MSKLVRYSWVLLIGIAVTALAAASPDFSGSYSAKNDDKKSATTVLRVVQSDSAVEVSTVSGDKTTTNRFPLDGSEGDYVTETGARGKCKAQLKNGKLVLESLVASPPRADRPSIRFHTTEEWQLSADGNTLTVKTEISSPDMPREVIAAAFPNNPRKQRYERMAKP